MGMRFGKGKMLLALGALLIGTAAGMEGRISADAPAMSVVSLDGMGSEAVFGKTREVIRFGYQDGFFMRSVHDFWDGSKAVFVNNRDPAAASVSADGTATGEAPVEFLIHYMPNGEGPTNVPVPSEAERRDRGLTAVAKDEQDRFWTIRKGTIREVIGTPRAGPIVRNHSLALMEFGWTVSQEGKSVDLAEVLGQTENPDRYISDVRYGGGILYVLLDSLSGGGRQAAALDPGTYRLLYRLPLPDGALFIPMKDGKAAVLSGGEVTRYDGTGRRIGSLAISDRYRMLLRAEPGYAAPVGGGNAFILRTPEQWIHMDGQVSRITDVTPRRGGMRPECPNCPGYEQWLPVDTRHYLHVKDQTGLTLYRSDPVGISFFGERLLTDTPAYLDATEGKVWVPLRAAVEAMEYEVGYDGDRRLIELRLPGRTVTVNQDHPEIEMQTVKEYGRTYVSVRQLSELLGETVEWDQENYTVNVARGETLNLTLPGSVLRNREQLRERLSALDDFDAVTYTQAQIKQIWAGGKQTDPEVTLQSFLENSLQKDYEFSFLLSDDGTHRWVGAIARDGNVYKVHLERRTDYGSEFWIVASYGTLSVTDVPYSSIDKGMRLSRYLSFHAELAEGEFQIYNDATFDLDLSGCRIELDTLQAGFTLPEGYIMKAGASVRILAGNAFSKAKQTGLTEERDGILYWTEELPLAAVTAAPAVRLLDASGKPALTASTR